jgi:hypothetical protein
MQRQAQVKEMQRQVQAEKERGMATFNDQTWKNGENVCSVSC